MKSKYSNLLKSISLESRYRTTIAVNVLLFIEKKIIKGKLTNRQAEEVYEMSEYITHSLIKTLHEWEKDKAIIYENDECIIPDNPLLQ